jgi:DNA polymerase III alpha subunit
MENEVPKEEIQQDNSQVEPNPETSQPVEKVPSTIISTEEPKQESPSVEPPKKELPTNSEQQTPQTPPPSNYQAQTNPSQISTPGQFKRNIAFQIRIGELSDGKQILDGERFHHLALNDKQIVRVNIIANVVDKFIAEGERPYGTLTMDDATGQIRLKAFGEDLSKIQDFNLGDTLLIIGLLRTWNDELYVTPEIIRKKDPQYLLVRKMERESSMPKQLNSEERTELKDTMLNKIKEAEAEEGIDVEKIILDLKETPDTINKEIKTLLEEGLIYEPRPGKLRYLG